MLDYELIKIALKRSNEVLFNKLWTPKPSQKVSARQLYFNARIPLRSNVWMITMCHAVYTQAG